jgi:hypothetical protein
MDVADVRRRVRQALDRARRDQEVRRARSDEARRHYERFLSEIATPVFRLCATALRAEGHPFVVHTPAGSVRLAGEHARDDFIELALDTASDPPVVVGHVRRGRGSRIETFEQPLREGRSVEQLTDEDVLGFVLSQIGRFVER